VLPTPTVGMVGIVEHETDGCGIAFPEAGLDIVLVGETRDELGGSEWQQMFARDAVVKPPSVDLDREKALIDLILSAYEHRLIRSAHDVSNGGLAIALAEASMEGTGCHVELAGHADDLDAFSLLFSESQARAIVASDRADELIPLAKKHGVPAMRIGRTEPAVFLIERNGAPLVRTTVPELSRIWRSAFALLLGGDTIEDVIRGVGEEADLIAH
jgi:phosphoribosylformylglycinamidine (FGAM) synthase-like enzyme